jgi:hypothetical protein
MNFVIKTTLQTYEPSVIREITNFLFKHPNLCAILVTNLDCHSGKSVAGIFVKVEKCSDRFIRNPFYKSNI